MTDLEPGTTMWRITDLERRVDALCVALKSLSDAVQILGNEIKAASKP